MKKTIGFSRQIMLILISLSMITTVLTGFIGFNIAKKLNERLVLDKIEGITESTYNLIDSAVNTSIRNYLRAISEKNKDIVESYYAKYKSGELTEEEARREVEKIILSQKVGDSGYLYVVDSNGFLKIHPQMKNSNIWNYNFFYEQIQMKYGYIEYNWKNPDDKNVRPKVLYMTYFEPWDYIISATSYKSEFIKLVNTSDFKENILSIILGETGYMYVLNSYGDLIIHPKQEGKNIYDSIDTKGNYFIKEIIKNKTGDIVYPWINPGEKSPRDKLVIYKYYEPMDWYLCSGVYLDELYEPIDLLKKALLTAFVFILILSIIISLIYSRIIVNPIKNLEKAASNIMNGNFDVKIENTRHDEIGNLTEIFNNMAIKIKNYMSSLQLTNKKSEEMNITLEQKVCERTSQLIQSNKILEEEIEERIKTEKLLELRYKELDETKEKLEIVNKKLEKLSNLDSLTGIPNRRYLDEFLKLEWNNSKKEETPLSIIMLDIDYFKKFNDTYGHLAGDDCLKNIGEVLSKSVKKSNSFVVRYGGEEFLVVLPNTDNISANKIAENIRKNIESLNIPHINSEIANHVTVSLGSSTIISHNNYNLEEFIKSADDALYKAKQTGKNKLVSVIYNN